MGLLSWLIAIPFLTTLVIVATPASRAGWIRWIAAIGTGAHLVLTAVVTYLFWQAAAPDAAAMTTAQFMKLYFVEQVPWFKSLGIQYLIGIDGISMAMVILTSIIIFAGVMASWNVKERPKEFFALLPVSYTHLTLPTKRIV